MKVTAPGPLATICLLSVGIGSSLMAQNSATFDENIKALYFEVLDYPLAARLTHVQGIVAVRVTFNDKGSVVSTTALSGPKILIPDCVGNSRKWRFAPNSDRTAVILYQFKIEGLCKSPCPSQFAFRPP